jgi:ABC-2 type transport system permease protein
VSGWQAPRRAQRAEGERSLLDAARLFAVYFRLGLLNELAYRTNFWVQIVETLVNLSIVLGAVGVVFARTETLGGWRAAELVALVGVYFIVLGMLNLVVAPSLSRFIEEVRTGALDFTLTKPVDAQLLVSISEIRTWKLVDLLAGFGVLGCALVLLAERVGPLQALGFGAALLAGAAIVYSFWLVLATLAFWFVRVENILMIFMNVYSAGRWPIGIYPGWLRWLLTLVVPIAFAVSVPAEALTGRMSARELAGALALATALLLGSRAFWKRGLRHYSGASA